MHRHMVNRNTKSTISIDPNLRDTHFTHCLTKTRSSRTRRYLARTERRGAQGAGVPVAGRWGTEPPELERRFSARGVAGDPIDAGLESLREIAPDLLVPGENILELQKNGGKIIWGIFRGLGFLLSWSEMGILCPNEGLEVEMIEYRRVQLYYVCLFYWAFSKILHVISLFIFLTYYVINKPSL